MGSVGANKSQSRGNNDIAGTINGVPVTYGEVQEAVLKTLDTNILQRNMQKTAEQMKKAEKEGNKEEYDRLAKQYKIMWNENNRRTRKR